MKRYGVRLSQRSPTAANPLLQVATVGPAGKRQKANTDLLLETSYETLQFRRPDSACVRKKLQTIMVGPYFRIDMLAP